MNDYYTLLGVDRSVSREALRHAYRTRILEIHPDHNPGNELASAHARQIIEAYRVLSNPVTRRDYDLAIGYPEANLATQTKACRQPMSFQWVPKLMFVMVVFAILAGLVYGAVFAVNSRDMVFRPRIENVITAPDPESPVLLGRQLPRIDANVAREDASILASNIIDCVCSQTAFNSQTQASPGFRFFAEAEPSL